MNNCYVPGMDFHNIPKTEPKQKEPAGKDYSPKCMYNTQGEYICQLDIKKEKDTELGYNYILNK